jgi:hypothetical protein
MEIQTLVSLLKVGALGGSLAFLILSFWLLKAVLSNKDASNNPVPPSRGALFAIFSFMTFSFLFLVTGILAENSSLILAHFFKEDVSRVRFNKWQFFPETKKIVFGFLEEPRNMSYYVPAEKKRNFDVYVAVRKRDSTPYSQGTFPVLIGAFGIESRPDLDKTLDNQELAQLGDDCIELVLFGVQKKDGKSVEVNRPFMPNKVGSDMIVFNWAVVCAKSG